MSICISLFYMDMIIYPCINPNAGLTKLCYQRGVGGQYVCVGEVFLNG